MCGNIVCLAAVLLGVDARWPSLPEGGLQYVIQIEPYALGGRQADASEVIRSHVPAYLNDVRAYQIVMGTRKLARDLPTPNVDSAISMGVDTDWVVLPSGGTECRVWIRPEVLDELAKPGRAIEGLIPANVTKPTMFTISVGTKPPVAKPPVAKPPVAKSSATIEGDPSGSIPAKADESPTNELPKEDVPAESLISPPLRPERSASQPPLPLSNVFPRSFGSIEPYDARTTLEQARPSPFPMTLPTPPFDPSNSGPDAGNAERASHWEQSPATLAGGSEANAALVSTDNGPSAKEPATMWPSRDVTLIGLLASFGGNVFLLWFVWNFHSRYRLLLRRLGEVKEIVTGCVSDLERAT